MIHRHPQYLHVVPIADLREHDLDNTCWCRPSVDGEAEEVLVHHSYNEIFEIEPRFH